MHDTAWALLDVLIVGNFGAGVVQAQYVKILVIVWNK